MCGKHFQAFESKSSQGVQQARPFVPEVSWIRRRDLHVLTSGVHTFASDQRFIALHADRSENWTLHIRFSQARDSGAYQCQVNTDPRISMLFHLTVTAPEPLSRLPAEAATLMDGSNQRYVRAGSDIQLSCRTSVASQPPGLLYWYRDAEILNTGGRVDIATELENETKSKLLIKGARVSDSGNYTCWPTKFLPASVMVHVIPVEFRFSINIFPFSYSSKRAKLSLASSIFSSLLELPDTA
ncbi:zwei Ig domain protein zig-8-like [Penaeus indicus]|uniref:zwei Ig domain protein zig-8-like n=1 Tax=Penaeus indicus TaxID=29960 RepID=UPI00300BFC7A